MAPNAPSNTRLATAFLSNTLSPFFEVAIDIDGGVEMRLIVRDEVDAGREGLEYGLDASGVPFFSTLQQAEKRAR